jgi:hypothetical protein
VTLESPHPKSTGNRDPSVSAREARGPGVDVTPPARSCVKWPPAGSWPRLPNLHAIACTLVLVTAASSTLAGVQPLEYLDQETGATVTVVSHPLVFARERSAAIYGQRDYVTLAAASVDQSGKITFMFIGYFWAAGAPQSHEEARCNAIVLQPQDARVALTPLGGPAREAGIAEPVHRPPFGRPVPCIYVVDLQIMQTIASSAHLELHGGEDTKSPTYQLFDDRLDALRELVRRLSRVN